MIAAQLWLTTMSSSTIPSSTVEGSTNAISMTVMNTESPLPATDSPPVLQVDSVVDASLDSLDTAGVWLLGIQHLSNAWGGRSAEFAFPLYLIELFHNTLLPVSLHGFIVTACGILLSGSVGSLVDKHRRLPSARASILSQKLSASLGYAIFIILFTQSAHDDHLLWPLFAAITVCGGILNLSSVGTAVCIERDWVMTIAGGHHDALVRLNSIMRRIDLLSKLLSPLFVSLLTATIGYTLSAAVLLSIGVFSSIFEMLFVAIVYRRFPVLDQPRERQPSSSSTNMADGARSGIRPNSVCRWTRRSRVWLRLQWCDWVEFAQHPIFLSSLSASLLYMTVLSFDGIFLSYLKSETDFSDPFIAGMRATCVLAGLIGTFMMPWLDRMIGLTRAASWSVWSEVLSLLPVVISLFLSANEHHRAAWNSAMLFGGMALSRIGLWSFDLAQLTQLQKDLEHHPRQNVLTALQIALQNVFTLGAYGLTLGWNKPRDFKFAAVVSLASVFVGAMVYVFGYSRRTRGHVFHFEKLPLLR
ncbi:Ferroporti-1 [Mycena olivaceomarginata]|nr:Ferroporti-1 [Mycena olivaceomarginata]